MGTRTIEGAGAFMRRAGPVWAIATLTVAVLAFVFLTRDAVTAADLREHGSVPHKGAATKAHAERVDKSIAALVSITQETARNVAALQATVAALVTELSEQRKVMLRVLEKR